LLWYRVDEGDTDPGVAFAYFTELARSGRRAGALPAYRPQDVERLDVFSRTFFRSFFGVIPAAATLVLDDAHAASGSVFDVLLAAAVREVPPDVAFVILSRHDPAGVLLEEVTRGAIQTLQATSLAFTGDEAAELLADSVDQVTARHLQARTKGWVAGMLLLAQAPVRSMSGDSRPSEWIGSYFDHTVLAPLDDAGRRTLAAVSLLPEVDIDSLREMGLDDSASDILEGMRRLHSFVTRLDRQPPSWRLHDLLRDALRARFSSIGDAAWRRRVRSAAARVATDRGLAREAVQLHLDAGDTHAATAAAESFALELVKSQRLAELDFIVAALDPAIVDGSMPLQIALGESATKRNNARAAVPRFERAIELIGGTDPCQIGLVIAASALGAILEGWQDYAGIEHWAAHLARHLGVRESVNDADERLRIDGVCLRAANTLWGARLGDRDVLIARILNALRHPAPSQQPDEAIAASLVLIHTAGFLLSDEQLFRDAVEATAPWLQRPELSPLPKAWWLSSYAPLGRRWSTPGAKLPAANPVACLELAIEIARECGGQSCAFNAASSLVHLAVADNDRVAGQERLALQREVTDPQNVIQSIGLMSNEGSVLALCGEWGPARAALDRALELAQQHGFPLSEQWHYFLGRQRIEIAAGDPGRARAALLRESANYPEGLRRDFALVLADVASAAQAMRTNGAVPVELVRSIMQRAREYAWPGFGTLLAPIAARLCAEALRNGIETEFVRQVVRERHLVAPSPYEPYWPWPIRVRALGALRVEVDEAPLEFGPRAQRKSLDLLKVIIAHGPEPVDAAIALDALWPDAEGGAARAAFDMTVMRLRKLLQHDHALRLDAGRVGLDPGSVWVDAFAFAKGVIDNYPGPLFGADAVLPWWAGARERLHQRFLRRTNERGAAMERSGEWEQALVLYEAALGQDPLAEHLYRGAIRCHLAAGRAADALRVYRRCREQLSIVLGVSPSTATSKLVAGISAR
jgi:DNA-binding SARP family transcriptional activator